MIGDTPYDGEAAHKADVEFIGLLCGGENDERTLRDAGAMSVWRDPADLLAHLEQAIDLAEPATAR
jgi:phosphoglycolate phosphatase-like HAD superfamily hydrolase